MNASAETFVIEIDASEFAPFALRAVRRPAGMSDETARRLAAMAVRDDMGLLGDATVRDSVDMLDEIIAASDPAGDTDDADDADDLPTAPFRLEPKSASERITRPVAIVPPPEARPSCERITMVRGERLATPDEITRRLDDPLRRVERAMRWLAIASVIASSFVIGHMAGSGRHRVSDPPRTIATLGSSPSGPIVGELTRGR